MAKRCLWLAVGFFYLGFFVSCSPCCRRNAHEALLHDRGHVGNRDPHGPEDLEAYIAHLESPERDSWQKPHEVVAALGLQPGSWVADVGSGPGYFARRLARVVPQGLVFAVDVEPRQLDRLNERIAADGLENVIPVLAPADHPRLPKGRFDVVLVVNTYHHFPERQSYLRHLREALRPSGRLAIVDYHAGELPVGPPPEHKLAREVVLEEVVRAGFRLVEEFSFLPYQYFLLFEPLPSDLPDQRVTD